MKKIWFSTKIVILSMLVVSNALADKTWESLTGIYEVVSLRNASDVAITIQTKPPISNTDTPIGQTIEFIGKQIKMPGLGCDSWEVRRIDKKIVNLQDPLLADLNVNPTDSPISSGEKRVNLSFAYSCEGEPFLQVFQLDGRVIVIPWANSSQYLIAERPLSAMQIKQFQHQLTSMKFYHGAATGKLDTSTLNSINSWVNYRLLRDDSYSFHRPVISENLLDTLGVISN